MNAFFDKRCPRGHRYGWLGRLGDDPGCSKCAAEAERKAALAGASADRGAPRQSASLDVLIARACEITGVDRDATLRRCVSDWLRRNGGVA